MSDRAMETQKSCTITPEAQAEAAERIRERRRAQEESQQAAAEYREEHPDGGDCEPTLEPADELEWLREQYVVLKQNNDSLRQAYSTVGQEASALRRVLASRQPTLRERAAIAVCAAIRVGRTTGSGVGESYTEIANESVAQADALVARLANG